jgi:hypothetical protein
MANFMTQYQLDVFFRPIVLSAQSERVYPAYSFHTGGIFQAISNCALYISQYMFCCCLSEFVLVDS